MAAKSDLDKKMDAFKKALESQYEASAGIKHEGTVLTIPASMSYKEAIDAIIAQQREMEEEVSNIAEFNANPDDALVCLSRSMREEFGKLSSQMSFSMFGPIPGRSRSVAVGYGENETVPYGPSAVPWLPITMNIKPVWDGNSYLGGMLVVQFTYQRKFQALVDRIIEITNDYIKHNSIYKGKAIDMSFKFLDASGFNDSKVVYSQTEQAILEANVWSPIRNTQIYRDLKQSLKRGILLYGPYGTGKTLTAMKTAKIAVNNGWTFINVNTGASIVNALKLAEHYAPAVVFFEDVDVDLGGQRDSRVNEILNSADGILGKNSEVVLVVTTNHEQKISRAMLRPGRIDSIIKLGELDADAVERMIRVALTDADGESLVEDSLDKDQIWKAAEGYVPAYVRGGTDRAMAYWLSRGRTGKINTSDLVFAFKELRPQFELMRSDQEIKAPDLDQAMTTVVDQKVAPLAEKINAIFEKFVG